MKRPAPLPPSIAQTKFVVQYIGAANSVDCVSFARHFSLNSGSTLCNGPGNFFSQIKVASNTFIVGTLEPKYRLGVGEVDRVFEMVALIERVCVVVSEYYRERFQLWELLRKSGGFDDPLFLLFLIFRPRACASLK
jgi:hypothetical protein